MTRLISKNNSFINGILGLTLLCFTSCASGTYYKAGEDRQAHPERYAKDTHQTYQGHYYASDRNVEPRYSQGKKCNTKKR